MPCERLLLTLRDEVFEGRERAKGARSESGQGSHELCGSFCAGIIESPSRIRLGAFLLGDFGSEGVRIFTVKARERKLPDDPDNPDNLKGSAKPDESEPSTVQRRWRLSPS